MRRVYQLLILLVASSTLCCASVRPVLFRTPNEQYAAGVKITTSCLGEVFGYGSGVIVSKDRILTAGHVVTCPMGFPAEIKVDPGDGDDREATVEVLLPDADIARLQVTSDLSKWFRPIEVGQATHLSERVCWSAMVPRATYRCGTAQAARSDGGIAFDGFVEHGNSGAGLYGDDGRLIGLVTKTGACQTGVYCVGWATTMAGREWLMP